MNELDGISRIIKHANISDVLELLQAQCVSLKQLLDPWLVAFIHGPGLVAFNVNLESTEMQILTNFHKKSCTSN